jgi:hypothetical protein
MNIVYSDDETLLDSQEMDRIRKAIAEGREISLVTHVLTPEGEDKIKYIIRCILDTYNRPDLLELLYTACKELTINSTKAAIKRLLFIEKKLDPRNVKQYEYGMSSFKGSLNLKKFPHYKKQMREYGLNIKINFSFDESKLVLKIINNFSLLPEEERRIREKFLNAQRYDSLFDFYMEHGDNTEGAGMGITLVEILLGQSGFDKHLFTIYSGKGKDETVAKVILPLKKEYQSPRIKFEEELQYGKAVEQLREAYNKYEF